MNSRSDHAKNLNNLSNIEQLVTVYSAIPNKIPVSFYPLNSANQSSRKMLVEMTDFIFLNTTYQYKDIRENHFLAVKIKQ